MQFDQENVRGSMPLFGKRLVVIGGTSGIGFAIAKEAQVMGAEVIVASSKPSNVDRAIRELPGAQGEAVDMCNEERVSQFFSTTGSLDHLVITAGDWESVSVLRKSCRELDLQAAQGSMSVRLWGAMAAIKHASRYLSERGSITLTAGMLAHRPMKGAPLMTAMAGAVEHLARGLAIDLAPIRVNAVSPGLTLTEVVRQMPAELVQAMVSSLPLQRAATPQEAAQAYIYLMLNDYITGQILPVDGGGLLI